MIHFFVGTKAQFIKMAPVMLELDSRGLGYRYLDSGQHAEMTSSLRSSFGIRSPDFRFKHEGGDVDTVAKAAGWYLACLGRGVVSRKWLDTNVFPGGGICVVHGDTLSTILGVQLARRARLKVAHLEAGLRSFSYWDPFPEELIRLYCMKRSDLLFAPSQESARNLSDLGVKGRVVALPANTVVDSLRLMGRMDTDVAVPQGEFALATCHRLETISSRPRLGKIVGLLNRVAEEIPVVFVTHKPTQKALRRFGLERKLESNVSQLEMQTYPRFVAHLLKAKFVMTDGGSIQEECAYLRKRCLILRRRTERPDGLGETAVVWGFDYQVAESFLASATAAEPVAIESLPSCSSDVVDVLTEYSN